MQEIYNRKQKLLLELNAKQAQHGILTEELNKQIDLIVEYRQEASRLNELKQQNDKLVGEINGLKENIKGCDEELRMMSCLTKVKSQKKEIEAER